MFISSMPASLQLYHRVLVEEFLREWRFLADVLANRATAKADFTDKLLEIFKAASSFGLNQISLPGMGAVGQGLELALDWGNDLRKETPKQMQQQLYQIEEQRLRMIVEVAALEACCRYQFAILTQLSENDLEGVIPLAKAGVERMLEYVVRNQLNISCENLIDGLIAGHSGAYVTGYTNTQLTPRHPGAPRATKQLKNKVGFTGYTAEGLYGRSGLLISSNGKLEYYALNENDKKYARHKYKKNLDKQIEGLSIPKAFRLRKAALFDYGYTKFKKTHPNDPKYGYIYGSVTIKEQLYGHLQQEPQIKIRQQYQELSPDLQQQLTAFKPHLVVINKADLLSYLERRQGHPELSLLEFIRQQKISVGFLQTSEIVGVMYGPINAEEHDLSKLDLKGADLSNTVFRGCIFGRSLAKTKFDHSDLRFSDFTQVTDATELSLQSAQVQQTRWNGVKLPKANLTQADFSYADMAETVLDEAITLGTFWYKTILLNVKYKDISQLLGQQAKQREAIEQQRAVIKTLEEKFKQQQDELSQIHQQLSELLEKKDLEKTSPNQSLQNLIELTQGLYQEQQARLVLARYVESALIQLKSAQTLAEKKLTQHDKQIQNLEKQLEILKGQQADLQNLTHEIKAMNSTVLLQAEKITEVEKELEQFNSRFDTTMAKQKQEWERLKQDLQELTSRVARQESKLEKVDEQVVVLTQQVQKIQSRTNDAEKIDQLADLALQAIKQSYSNNNEITSIFGKVFKLQEEYINLHMLYHAESKDNKIQKEEEQPSSQKEGSNISNSEMQSQQPGSEEKVEKSKYHDARISSFEDLFGNKKTIKVDDLFKADKEILPEKSLTEQQKMSDAPNFLLIQGRAGIGKTTFVRYGVMSAFFKHFSWVFLLTLRELRNDNFKIITEKSEQISLCEWIYEAQIRRNTSIAATEFSLIWQQCIEPAMKRRKVLIILDGYDEVPDRHRCQEALESLKRGAYAQLPKIITSRPYGVSDLPQNRRNLEIMGFTNENIEKYVKTYFAEDAGIAKKLTETLKTSPSLWGTSHIPVNLSLICGIVEQANRVSTKGAIESEFARLQTMTGTYEMMEEKLFERCYLEKENTTKPLSSIKQKRTDFLLHQHYKVERHFLAELAFKGFLQQQIILPREIVNQLLIAFKIQEDVAFMQRLCTLGLIKPVIENNRVPENEQNYEFLHLTFQEYYAAVHIVEVLENSNLKQREQMERFVLAQKFDPRWQIVWWFLASLSRDKAKVLQALNLLKSEAQSSKAKRSETVSKKGTIELPENDKIFSATQENNYQTKDLIGHYELGLLVRCLEESSDSQNLSFRAEVTEKIQKKLLQYYQLFCAGLLPEDFSSPLIEMLKISPKWLRQSGEKDLFFIIFSGKYRVEKIFKKNDVNEEIRKRLKSFITFFKLVTPIVSQFLVEDLMAPPPPKPFLVWWNHYDSTKTFETLGTVAATPEVLEGLCMCLSEKKNEVIKVFRYLQASSVATNVLNKFYQYLENEEQRNAAISILVIFGTSAITTKIVNKICELLNHENDFVQKSIVKAFIVGLNLEYYGYYKFVSKRELAQFQKNKDNIAIQPRCIVDTPEILKALGKLLIKSNNISICKDIIKIIKVMGPPAVTPEVLGAFPELLRQGDYNFDILDIIEGVGETAAIPALISTLANLLKETENDEFSKKLLETIKELGKSAAVPEIINLLPKFLDKDKEMLCGVTLNLISKLGIATTPKILEKLKVLSEHRLEHTAKVRNLGLHAELIIKKPIINEENREELEKYYVMEYLKNKTENFFNYFDNENSESFKNTDEIAACAFFALIFDIKIPFEFFDKLLKGIVTNKIAKIKVNGIATVLPILVSISEDGAAFLKIITDYLNHANFIVRLFAISILSNCIVFAENENKADECVDELANIVEEFNIPGIMPKNLEVFNKMKNNIRKIKIILDSIEVKNKIIALLKDENPNVRLVAIKAAYEFDKKNESSALLKELTKLLKDQELYKEALETIIELSTDSEKISELFLDNLVVLLEDKSMRIKALNAIDGLSPKLITASLIEKMTILLVEYDKNEQKKSEDKKAEYKKHSPFMSRLPSFLTTRTVSNVGEQQFSLTLKNTICRLISLAPTENILNKLATFLFDDNVCTQALEIITTIGPPAATRSIVAALNKLLVTKDKKHLFERTLKAILALGPMAMTSGITDSFATLMDVKEIRFLLVEAILQLGDAAITPKILERFLHFCLTKEIEMESILKLNFIKLIQIWLNQFQKMLPKKALEALSLITIQAYLSGNITCQVFWDNEKSTYCLKGFKDKEPYEFPISPLQAQCFRHLIPVIIIQFETQGKIKIDIEMLRKTLQQKPGIEADSELFDMPREKLIAFSQKQWQWEKISLATLMTSNRFTKSIFNPRQSQVELPQDSGEQVSESECKMM